jgi:hypothetical protein
MITIVAATELEARAVRRTWRGAHIRRVGVGGGTRVEGAAISCGLAGGVQPHARTGDVLIPGEIVRPDGTMRACDPALVEQLRAAARALGHEPVTARIATCDRVIGGAERATFASGGFAGVDMESTRIDAERIAVVRVVLDTPSREIAPAWTTPRRAFLTPSAWRDLPFLLREAPRCAHLAAAIVAKAFA